MSLFRNTKDKLEELRFVGLIPIHFGTRLKMHFYISTGSSCVMFVILLAMYIGMDTPFSMVYKYSHSYQETLELARYKNNVRTTKALDYIYSLNGSTGRILDFERSTIDVLIVIVSVSRDKESRSGKTGYLLQTAASMDKFVKSDKYFSKKFMFVCNVDKNPTRHIDAIELQSYFPYIQKYGHNNLGLNASSPPELRGSGLVDEARKQEIVDYAFCLNVSVSFNHRYVLVVEDDVIPNKDLFEVLHHTLKYRLNANTFDYDNTVSHKNFSFLKLYFPQRWQGYAFETDRILELTSIGTLGGALFAVITSFLESEALPKTRKRKSSTAIYFLSGFLCFIVIAKIIGRVNMMELRRLTPYLLTFRRSSACCTQALLYRKEVLPAIIRHMLNNNSLNKDLAIYDFSQKYSMTGYQLEPNLFFHTGMQPSLSSNTKNPEEFLFDLPSLE